MSDAAVPDSTGASSGGAGSRAAGNGGAGAADTGSRGTNDTDTGGRDAGNGGAGNSSDPTATSTPTAVPAPILSSAEPDLEPVLAGDAAGTDTGSGGWQLQTQSNQYVYAGMLVTTAELGMQTYTQPRIVNQTDQPLVASLEISELGSDNGKLVATSQQSRGKFSATSWLTVPEEVTAPPRGSADIRISMSIPQNAVAGDYTAALNVSAGTNQKIIPLVIRVRGARQQELTVTDNAATENTATENKGDASSVELSGVGLWPLTTAEARSTMSVTNTGSTIIAGHLHPYIASLFSQQGRISADESGLTETARRRIIAEQPTVVVLPGDTLQHEFAGTFLPGYRATNVLAVEVPYQDAAGQTRFYAIRAAGDGAQATPWLLVAAALVVPIAITMSWWLLRRRRQE